MTDVALSTFPSPLVVSMTATRQTTVGTVVFGEVVAGDSTLSAEPGVYALSGLGVSFGYTRAARHFALSALPSPFIVGEVGVDSVASGVLILGGAAGGQFSIRADGGLFALAGAAADIANSGKFEGERGSFVLTGRAATPRKGYRIGAATGEFVYIHASVLKIIYAVPVAFALLGQAADVVYNPSTTTLVAAGGAFSLLGGSAEFTWNVGFSVSAGAFTLTGHDVTFMRPARLYAAVGTFALVAPDIAIDAPRILARPLYSKLIVAGPS